MDENNVTLTRVGGIRVGHAHDLEALTGCTVVLCEAGAVAGVDQRGGAPGTRETDLLRPMHLVERVHAVVLAGGSAFGLDAASGVVRYLSERGIGYDTGLARVPIVPAAVLFDLGMGRADAWPDAAMGYHACQLANAGPVVEGNVGAGAGATAGKVLGMAQASKTGIGCAGVELADGLVIAALMAVNPYGDVVDPRTGDVLAGVRDAGEGHFVGALTAMAAVGESSAHPRDPGLLTNTVIGIVVTNAVLDKVQVNKVAQMAQDGLARAIRPAHTMRDGDTLFALATGAQPADVDLVGAYAAEVVAQAIVRAALTAQGARGI